MIGRVLGSYRIVRELGRGGMGTVYLAEHTLLGRQAAIKVLRPESSANHTLVTRFFNEARAATAIRHLGIVEVYDFGYGDDGVAYIAMEYLRGESLSRRLGRGRLEPAQALTVIRQIASPLAAAHRAGIVHRDLKPDNVFVVPDDEAAGGERVKLLDFGVAKLSAELTSGDQTHSGVIVGTPTYMAPEQCRGVTVDHRADLYSMGCILFRLLTGGPPFTGEGVGDVLTGHIHLPPPFPSTSVPGLDPAIDDLVVRLLAKRPDDRPRTVEEVVRAIDGILGPGRELSFGGASPAARPVEAGRLRPPTSRPLPLPPPEPSLPMAPASWLASLAEAGADQPSLTGTVTGASLARPVAPPPAAARSPRSRWLAVGGTAAVVSAVVIAVIVAGEPDDRQEPAPGPAVAAIPTPHAAPAVAPVPEAVPVPVPVPDAVPVPAPDAVPVPDTIRLTITSVPTGATVVIAGRDVGTTPFTAPWPRSDRPLDVVLARKGYRSEHVQLTPTAAVERTVTLARVRPSASPAIAPPPPHGLTPTNPFPR